MKTYTCKQCDDKPQFQGRSALLAHYKVNHPSLKPAKEPKTCTTTPVMDAIHAAEKVLRNSVKDLEFERNQLHQRLLELDTLIAKYSKV